ncbi:immunity 26/phosphotriesterase HocA family protein [Paenibacillus campi]|uniref:immunity 26/phosphotriesterase HocA family protein n=1 Tax=Paenibacillus campi TaxID=3106031 RepID=UPI002B001C89|nr:immunity 26/phosphotriesterase HocA family protein [Paenibacillus sp. SGZ-1009]
MNNYQAGDLFTIPLYDGRWAIGQVVCALHDRFQQAFSFGVLSIGVERHIPEQAGEFIALDQQRAFPQLLFASSSNLRRKWKIIAHLPLTEQQQALQSFHVGGHLYHNDE